MTEVIPTSYFIVEGPFTREKLNLNLTAAMFMTYPNLICGTFSLPMTFEQIEYGQLFFGSQGQQLLENTYAIHICHIFDICTLTIFLLRSHDFDKKC